MVRFHLLKSSSAFRSSRAHSRPSLVSHRVVAQRIARLALSSDIAPVAFRIVYMGFHLESFTSFSTFSMSILSSFESFSFLPASQSGLLSTTFAASFATDFAFFAKESQTEDSLSAISNIFGCFFIPKVYIVISYHIIFYNAKIEKV